MISVESRTFFPSRVFSAPLKGFSLELDIGARGQKTGMMGLPGREKSLTISSAVWIQYTNVTDGQTDGRPDGQIPADSKIRTNAVKIMNNNVVFDVVCAVRLQYSNIVGYALTKSKAPIYYSADDCGGGQRDGRARLGHGGSCPLPAG